MGGAPEEGLLAALHVAELDGVAALVGQRPAVQPARAPAAVRQAPPRRGARRHPCNGAV